MTLPINSFILTGGETQRLKPCHDCPASYYGNYSHQNSVERIVEMAKAIGPHKCHNAPRAACAQNLLIGPKGECIAQDFVYEGMVKAGR